ncbi:hypothetical protein [Niabella hirudinis]|uniref:hypothetical protein n=1 Tax=Niabella hirudinis TaxID=1285929 RepID=UPI003EBAC263
MKFRTMRLITAFCCLFPFVSGAQRIFTGRVLDNYSERPVAHATVTINGVAVQAGKDGYFEIHAPGKTPNTIHVSHISFRDTVLTGVPEVFQLIKLNKRVKEMDEVIVPSANNAEEIIRMANRAVCGNYPRKKILTEGYHVARESFNDEGVVYEDTALVRAQIPSYCKPVPAMLNLIQNKSGIMVRDSNLARSAVFSGGYYFVKGVDYVHRQVFSEENMRLYRFIRKPDSVTANQQLYVIAFQTRAKSDLLMEGTVYIDKETRAFVSFYVNLVRYPRRDYQYAIEKEYASIIVHYKMAANRKYYLQSFSSENIRTQTRINDPGMVQAARLKQAYITLRVKEHGPFDQNALLGETLTFSEISKPTELIPWKEATAAAAAGEMVLED